MEAYKINTINDTEKIALYKEEKRRNKQKEKTIAKIKQKIAGIAMVIIGIASIFIENDATFALFIVPLALYVAITKENVMQF